MLYFRNPRIAFGDRSDTPSGEPLPAEVDRPLMQNSGWPALSFLPTVANGATESLVGTARVTVLGAGTIHPPSSLRMRRKSHYLSLLPRASGL